MRKIQLQKTEQGSENSPPFILVIDDSATVCKIIEITLQRAGYRVNAFLDGVTALTWLNSEEASLPVLLFIDIEMPKLNGYQVVRHLKANPAFAKIKVVMMSRRDGVVDRLKARLCGALDYITKPFTTQQLLSLTQQYLGQSSHSGLSEGNANRNEEKGSFHG